MNNLPVNCLLDGPIPDPRKKKQTQAEREHVSHYHTLYGGAMTLTWFLRLNLPSAVQKLLCYPESCLLVTQDGDTVGKTFTNITLSDWSGEHCLLIHTGSYARLRDGVEVGADITGFITKEFKVIQELCHEWTYFEGVKLDRKTYLMREDGQKIFCQIILTKDDKVKKDISFHIPFVDLKTFVSEATSVLLQRLIVQQKRSGEIDLACLSSKGKVVKCNYRILGSGYENVKGEDTKVWGIRRTVWVEKKEIYCWDSLFNYYGRLVLRCQPDNDHAIVPLWFKPVDERDDLGNFIGVLPPLVWACDMEVHSQFLIKKTELNGTYKTYLLDHPQLRAILSDFLQKVLLVKPRGLVDFAKQFFQPFLLARPESAESTAKSSSSSSSWESFGGEYGEWDGEDGTKKQNLSFLYPKKTYRLEDYFFNDENFIVPPRGDQSSDEEENQEVEEEPSPTPVPQNTIPN